MTVLVLMCKYFTVILIGETIMVNIHVQAL